MKQERAGRTRRALLEAAAAEFDRRGYAGASLAGIAAAAGISIGALTFHFSSKNQLARAVRDQGIAATRALVADATARREAPFQCVVSLTVTLVELLERDVSVRAAARLAREAYDDQHRWESEWVPVIGERLRAGAEGTSHGTDSAALTAMAVHLVCGVEATLRHRGLPDDGQSNSDMLTRIWQLLPHASPAAGGVDA
ncbi:TetR family transcriptional regulator [Streptomyces sp. NPDC050658]|uniref:TetR family transcriptional regulator n=1 Tax=unclassified Streptomyces TaxID=2593676 RepID=UPI0034227BBB